MLVELSLAVVLLLFVSLWAFRTNLQTVRPRNWAMVQTLTDAYMTGELARAESIDFDALVDPANSPWPEQVTGVNSTPQTVQIGTLPGGFPLNGQLVRTRVADANNMPPFGTLPTPAQLASNPARIESWSVQSHLTYSIRGRDYVKSRTTIRTR